MVDETSLYLFPEKETIDSLPLLLEVLSPVVKKRKIPVFLMTNSVIQNIEHWQNDFPWLESLQTEYGENGASLNTAIANATTTRVISLSTDVLPKPQWLEALINTSEMFPKAAFIASTIEMGYTPGLLHSEGVEVISSGEACLRNFRQDLNPSKSQEPVLAPCRLAALYRVDIIRRVGLFDENMGDLYSDADLGIRALLLGLGGVCSSKAQAIWLAPPPNLKNAVYSWHSRLSDQATLAYKNFPLGLILSNWSPLLRGSFRQLIAARKRKQTIAYLRTRASFLYNIKLLSRHRRRMLFDPRLNFTRLKKYLCNGELPSLDC